MGRERVEAVKDVGRVQDSGVAFARLFDEEIEQARTDQHVQVDRHLRERTATVQLSLTLTRERRFTVLRLFCDSVGEPVAKKKRAKKKATLTSSRRSTSHGAMSPLTIWTRRRSPSETSCMCHSRSTSLYGRVIEHEVRVDCSSCRWTIDPDNHEQGSRTGYQGGDPAVPCSGNRRSSPCHRSSHGPSALADVV